MKDEGGKKSSQKLRRFVAWKLANLADVSVADVCCWDFVLVR